MSISVAAPNSTIGQATESSQSMTSNGNSPSVLPATTAASGFGQDEVAHMGRRLFRTLEQPDRPMIGIDCGSISVELLKATTDRFLTDRTLRDSHNLVLAVPTDESFSQSQAFDVIQSVKQSAFENGFDGKVSWLLIEEPSTEIPALQTLAGRQGGNWHASV